MEDKIKYEKHWLKLLVEGDEKAYKRLFELYYSSLVMFAAKYLRDTDLVLSRYLLLQYHAGAYHHHNNRQIKNIPCIAAGH